MLDRHLIREDPDRVIMGVKSKHVDADVDRIVALDRELLAIMKESEALKHERNVKSEEVGKKNVPVKTLTNFRPTSRTFPTGSRSSKRRTRRSARSSTRSS